MRIKKLAQAVAFIGIAGPVLAQQAGTDGGPVRMEKVIITGSSIKRIESEGALPLQIITKEDIDRAGITSAEQLMETISANASGAHNLASQQGFVTSFAPGRQFNNGQSAANLRGLGSGSTLVLLNGRRISTHGLAGKSVDLNSIPLAAVVRVEILKDGASAIYGTDAIGGVINFILRTDYEGAELSAFSDITQHGGGNIYRASVLAGTGSMAKDGYNLMGSLTYDKNERLRSIDRDFARNGFQPDRGLSPDTTGTPFATLRTGSGTALPSAFRVTGNSTLFTRVNVLSLQGKCDSIPGMSQYQAALWGNPSNAVSCAYDYGRDTILQQPVERLNYVGRANFRINPNHSAFVEVVGSSTKSTQEFVASQFTLDTFYPAGGPYYLDLSPFISTFDRTKPLRLRWRCLECGPRTQETQVDAVRILAGLEGVIAGWDYKLGISGAGSKADTTLVNGYVFTSAFNTAMLTGKINPFLLPGQSQTAEALALIDSTRANGSKLFGGETTLRQIDGTISRELFALPGGPLAAAAGFDFRRESYRFRPDAGVSTAEIKDAGGDPALDKATRDIKAFFAELSVPVIKQLEVQLAVRRDDYSNIGSTTNPKIAIRFQPLRSLVFRGSAGKGFHAPDYPQLYTGQTEGLLNNATLDPACPQILVAQNACVDKWNTLSGGNPNLKPETSRQWSAGFVAAPVDWFTATVDYWSIKRKDLIVSLDPRDVLANYDVLGSNVIRDANGVIKDITGGFINAAGDETKGVDIGLNFNGRYGAARWTASMDGTYLDSYKARLLANQPFTEYAGQFGNGSFTDVYVRWKHYANFTWTQGAWSTTFAQRYTRGYKDELPLGTVPPGFDPYVKSYTLYNISTTYTGFKNTSLTFGIKNLFDTKPPFSAHNVDDVGGTGWDARVADPRGRSFIARAAYKF